MRVSDLPDFQLLPDAIQECFMDLDRKFPNIEDITNLNFSGLHSRNMLLTSLEEPMVEALCNILRECKNLERLNVSNNVLYNNLHPVKAGDADDEGFDDLATYLDVENYPQTLLFKMLSAVTLNLKELDLSASIFTWESNIDSNMIRGLFEQVKKFSLLRKVDFNCNQLSRFNENLFSEFIKLIGNLKELESLSAYSGEIYDHLIYRKLTQKPELLAVLIQHSALKEIVLANSAFEEDAIIGQIPTVEGFRLSITRNAQDYNFVKWEREIASPTSSVRKTF